MAIDLESADYYRTLQVDPHAELTVIRAAHRALAAKYHPDVGGLQSDMAALNVAWTVLSDPARRAAYDRQRRLRQDGERYSPESRTPPEHHDGSVIDFGRYAGWSIPEIARSDSNYLEWLVRTPNGRRYQREVAEVLGEPEPAAATVSPVAGLRWFRHH